MSAYPLLDMLQANDLEKFLVLGSEQGVSHYVGLTGTDANIIYLDKLVIAGLWSDEREYQLWIEDEEVKSICAIPKEDYADEFDFYELDQEDTLHVNGVLQLLAVQILPEHRTTRTEFEQFLTLVLGKGFESPIEMPTNTADQWDYLSAQFEDAGQLTRFEWPEWAEGGIEALNSLAIIQNEKLKLAEPDEDEIEAIRNSDDWESAIFQYFNKQLEQKDLAVFAIGQFFDEYQEFLIVPKTDLRAMNVMLLANRLGLIIR